MITIDNTTKTEVETNILEYAITQGITEFIEVEEQLSTLVSRQHDKIVSLSSKGTVYALNLLRFWREQ